MAPRLGSVRDSFSLASAAGRVKANLAPVPAPAPDLPAFLRLVVWKGGALDRSFRLKTAGGLFDLDGSEMVASFAWPGGGSLILSSAADELEVDVEAAIVRLVLTPEHTAAWPEGGSAVSWQLDRVIGAPPSPILHGPVDVYRWMPANA